jgi:integrase
MIKLLRELQDVQRSDYLFNNRTSTGPISRHTFRQGVSRIIKRTSLDPFQPRDLRRTWKTLAAKAGLGLELRARIQGHALSDVGSRHYDRHDYLPEKQNAMNKWSRWLSKQLEQTADNVVRLHG